MSILLLVLAVFLSSLFSLILSGSLHLSLVSVLLCLFFVFALSLLITGPACGNLSEWLLPAHLKKFHLGSTSFLSIYTSGSITHHHQQLFVNIQKPPTSGSIMHHICLSWSMDTFISSFTWNKYFLGKFQAVKHVS